MNTQERHCVTGAYGYSGKYIAQRLLEHGHDVFTLTNAPDRPNPFAGRVPALPFHFDDEVQITRALEGVSVLYNTYWVRFNHRLFQYADAVRNTQVLFRAAKAAGVQRIVHVSITNPDETSPLEYFRGKATLERSLRETGIPHTMLRPAVLFGREDVLINNIAWVLRRFPLFGVFGNGAYRLQPIHVDDFADLAVREGCAEGDRVVNAIGPETYTYRALVEEIGTAIQRPRRIVSVPPILGWLAGTLVGWRQGDVFITRDEIKGLMADLLCVDTPPTGTTRLSDWARANGDSLGLHYSNELARRTRRGQAYAALNRRSV